MHNSDRGVSDLVGFVLIFGLILTSVTIVYATGFQSLSNAQDAEEVRNVERAYDILSDNIQEVSHGDAPSRGTELQLGSSQLTSGDAVTFTVTVGGDSVSIDAYPIVYEASNGEKLIYVNGAVIREARGGSTMSEEPPIIVRDDRVLLPIIETRPTDVVGVSGGQVIVNAEDTGSSTLSYHEPGETYDVEFTVETPRSEVWGRYCERNSDLSVAATGTNSVTCEYNGGSADSVYVQFRRLDISIDS